MVRISLIALLVAIMSAFFGFGASSTTAAASLAKLLVFVSSVFFVISLFTGIVSTRRTTIS